MINIIEFILLCVNLACLNIFTLANQTIGSVISFGVAMTILGKFFISYAKAYSGTYITPLKSKGYWDSVLNIFDDNWEDNWGDDDFIYRQRPHRGRTSVPSRSYVKIDELADIKKKLGTPTASIELIKEEVKEQPKEQVTIEVEETKPEEIKRGGCVVMMNTSAVPKGLKEMYTTIGKCLEFYFKDNKVKLYYALQSILSVEVQPYGTLIYYYSYYGKNFGFTLPLDEIVKAIHFQLGDKTYRVKFQEVYCKSLLEHYIEENVTIKTKKE